MELVQSPVAQLPCQCGYLWVVHVDLESSNLFALVRSEEEGSAHPPSLVSNYGYADNDKGKWEKERCQNVPPLIINVERAWWTL